MKDRELEDAAQFVLDRVETLAVFRARVRFVDELPAALEREAERCTVISDTVASKGDYDRALREREDAEALRALAKSVSVLLDRRPRPATATP